MKEILKEIDNLKGFASEEELDNLREAVNIIDNMNVG